MSTLRLLFLVLSLIALAQADAFRFRSLRHSNPKCRLHKAIGDFCLSSECNFLDGCAEVMASHEPALRAQFSRGQFKPSARAAVAAWCRARWSEISACLSQSTRGATTVLPASCDAFTVACDAVANLFPSPVDASSGAFRAPVRFVFWSGARNEAASFARSRARGRGGRRARTFVLDDALYGRLLDKVGLVKDFNDPSLVSGGCSPLRGWPLASAIVPWEAASERAAVQLRPGDRAVLLLNNFRTTSVFMRVELPSIVRALAGEQLPEDERDALLAHNVGLSAGRQPRPQLSIRVNAHIKFPRQEIDHGASPETACRYIVAAIQAFARTGGHGLNGLQLSVECLSGCDATYERAACTSGGGGDLIPLTDVTFVQNTRVRSRSDAVALDESVLERARTFARRAAAL